MVIAYNLFQKCTCTLLKLKQQATHQTSQHCFPVHWCGTHCLIFHLAYCTRFWEILMSITGLTLLWRLAFSMNSKWSSIQINFRMKISNHCRIVLWLPKPSPTAKLIFLPSSGILCPWWNSFKRKRIHDLCEFVIMFVSAWKINLNKNKSILEKIEKDNTIVNPK